MSTVDTTEAPYVSTGAHYRSFVEFSELRGTFVNALRARVILDNCSECRDTLLLDCKAFRLPLPTSELILVPERWVSHKCPHGENGLVLEFETAAANKNVEADTESLRWKREEEIESPAWRNNLDATKGMGYPAREEGCYGSHPSHDDFDDESES